MSGRQAATKDRVKSDAEGGYHDTSHRSDRRSGLIHCVWPLPCRGRGFALAPSVPRTRSSPPVGPPGENRGPAAGPPGGSPPQPPEPPRPSIDIELGAAPADLCVTITKRDSTGLHYSCHVRAPRFRAYAEGVDEDWDFAERTDEIVRSYMNQFTKKKSDVNIIAELRGAGLRFFEIAPQKFKDAFWTLADAMQPFETISIVSQEPFIPWELMVPVRPDGTENKIPLGADYCVARWTDRKNVVAAPQKIRLTDCFIIAPGLRGQKQGAQMGEGRDSARAEDLRLQSRGHRSRQICRR
jgi:hypothetical protein